MFLSLGVLIPIAIHLWNIQQGKVLRVGSVALLTNDAVKNTSRIKLHELLLLTLRCLLIILLSLFLSQPQWITNAGTKKDWVMVDKNNIKQTYAHFKPQVDSLIQAGFEPHYFNKGFEKAILSDTVNIQDDTAATNYWVTLNQLNSKISSKAPVYIFTNNYLKNFTGERPVASGNIHWYSYALNDTASYITGRYAIQGDSVQLITANSLSTGNYNSYKTAPLQNSQAAGIDTATFQVTIYSKGYTADAVYIQSAVNAIQQFSHRKIAVSTINNIAQLPPKQDWLFWLSNEAVPQNIKTANLFVYVQGKEQAVQTWLSSAQDGNHISIYKRIIAPPAGDIMWSDGFGNALLTKEHGLPNIYRFYSRFDVQWNDLPWNNNLPQLVYALLYNTSGEAAIARNDKRLVDDRQLQPVILKEDKAQSLQTSSVNIANIILVLAFITFFLERYFSSRQKRGRARV